MMNSIYKTSDMKTPPPAPPPPPPPPPPPNSSMSNQETQQCFSGNRSTLDIVCSSTVKPHMKMRTLNWRRIPKKKVLNQTVEEVNTTFENFSRRSSLHCNSPRYDSIDERDSGDSDDDKNIWFLIAKSNKSIQEVQPTSSNNFRDETTPYTSKSASKIREMLESVRLRMAAVTAMSEPDSSLSPSDPLITLEGRRKPKNVTDAIDFDYLESLFCLNCQPNDSLDLDSPNFVRRLSMRTNASSDSVISSNSYYQDSSNTGDDDDLFFELENILDSKKSLNVNIFLKQLKNPDELIDRINQDDRSKIGKEKLENMFKLLPDEVEKNQLMKFYLKNKQNRLPVAERFLLQLITEVPNLKLRIRSMLLQEEYFTDLKEISPELDKVDKAAKEIRTSKMFRDLLNLVLVTGNFLNAGGYAADAAGFSLDCLDRLNEVRSNKPGINLIHYVAEVASKLNLIDFQQKELQHVELASKVCIESFKSDLSSMMDKIILLKRDTEKEAETNDNSNEKDNQLFMLNLLRNLDDIKSNVEFLKRRTTHNIEATRRSLASYLCEDPETFKLHECFRIILTFSQRLKNAFEENDRRQKIERSNCSLKRSNTIHSRTLKSTQSRLSLADTQSTKGFSYFNNNNSIESRRASLASTNSFFQPNLSRATSTFNVSRAVDTQEFDDLHDGLLKLLDDTNKKRSPEKQTRKKNHLFGSYRHASKLFRMPNMNG